MLSYEAARRLVVETAAGLQSNILTETVDLVNDPSLVLGRILAEEVVADREYPPFNRATRDGYAVRSADVAAAPRTLRVVGESKAGTAFDGRIAAGECVRIMTGAALPVDTDSVVMLEHTRPAETAAKDAVVIERPVQAGQNFVPAGTETRAGQVVLRHKARLGFAELALAAQVGQRRVCVYRRPRVAILSTGDEVVAVDQQPGPFEIRNSNSISLSAQTTLAGADPVLLDNAPDRVPELRARIECGLEEDILVLSGGVSVGKYDLVESVLRDLGAKFLFDSVEIRPGRPAVFGTCRGKLVFGLPGNPVSTMVTFELFAVPAIDILGGSDPRPLPSFKAKLAKPVDEKAGLAHFLPAVVSWPKGEPEVSQLPWQGSGDVAAVALANCFLVVSKEKLKLAAGEWVDVLPRRGLF